MNKSKDKRERREKAFMTVTAMRLMEEWRHQMYYKVCKALINGKIDSQTVRFAEMEISIYEKKQSL